MGIRLTVTHKIDFFQNRIDFHRSGHHIAQGSKVRQTIMVENYAEILRLAGVDEAGATEAFGD